MWFSPTFRTLWPKQKLILTHSPRSSCYQVSRTLLAKKTEWLLCPVVALRWYLHRTRSPSRPRHLFLSVLDPTRPTFKAAISYFLRQLIRSAREEFPDHLSPTYRVRAHDIQGATTSLLWSSNRALSEIIKMTCWRTQSVFATHYIRSVHRVQDGVFSLGLVVAAGSIVP